jgi:hypothetical protein
VEFVEGAIVAYKSDPRKNVLKASKSMSQDIRFNMWEGIGKRGEGFCYQQKKLRSKAAQSTLP